MVKYLKRQNGIDELQSLGQKRRKRYTISVRYSTKSGTKGKEAEKDNVSKVYFKLLQP